MKIVEKDGELIMRDFPTTNWAQGAVLILGALILAGGLSISVSNSPIQTSGVILFAFIVFILYFAYKKLSSPMITTRIKPEAQIIEVTKTNLITLKKTQNYKFSQIERFEMVGRKRERSLLYINSMILTDGSYIDLESEGYSTNTVSGISIRLNELLKDRKSQHNPAKKINRKMKAKRK